MITVQEYSQEALKELPEPGIQEIRRQEKVAPDALIELIKSLIGNPQGNYIMPAWSDLVLCAHRLLLIAALHPVTPAEQQVMGEWQATLLSGGSFKNISQEISVKWANCAQTALNVIDRLRQNYGATISRSATQTINGGQGGLVAPELNKVPASPDQVYILDCDLQGIHNFLVEAHSDGKRYLIQGYQGFYSAVWWSSASAYDATLDLPGPEGVTKERDSYGKGQDINALYGRFVPLVATLVQEGFNALSGGRSTWRQLPFNPADNAALAIKELPYLKVYVYIIRNPRSVYASLNGLAGSLCVQAAQSLPVPFVVDSGTVIGALGRLGLTATYQLAQQAHTFRVTADAQGQPLPSLKEKSILRVGLTDITRLTPADLPAQGQPVEVGFPAAGLEQVVTRLVQ